MQQLQCHAASLAPMHAFVYPCACSPRCRVSTLEAMAALLLELEDPEEGAARIHQGMLTNCKIKVRAGHG